MEVSFETLASALTAPGAIGVMPTDTVYGVVARAEDRVAVARLYALKRRERKPGTIIAATIDQLVALGIKRRYLTAVAQFWPGPVSVIVPCGSELAYVHQGVRSLAVRLPADPRIHDLLLQTGPLLTSSANQPGEPPAATIEHAKRYFGTNVNFYVDGGDFSNRPSSTIIRMVDDAVEVLRQGAVRIYETGENQHDIR